MTGHIPVSLQAFLTVDKDKDSIQYLISRVNQQRGSFRHLTEQSLLEEIKAQDAGNEGDIEQDTADKVEDGAEDLKSKREEISAAREQILKQIACDHRIL